MLNSPYRLNEQPGIAQGSLLVSTPVNAGADRSKLLILITRHNEISGTTGLILNKLIDSELSFGEINIQHKSFDFYYGGSHQADTVTFMVSFPSLRSGLRDSVYWINDFHDLVLLLNMINTTHVCIQAFRGCMKWEAGELNKELAEKQWWTTSHFNLDDLLMKRANRWAYYAKQSGGYFSPLVDAEIPIIYN